MRNLVSVNYQLSCSRVFGSSSRQFSSLCSSLSFKLVSLLLYHLFHLLLRLCILQEYEYVHNAAMVGGSVLPVKFLLVSRESAIQRSYYAIQGQGRLAIGGDPVFCSVIRLPLQKELKKNLLPKSIFKLANVLPLPRQRAEPRRLP